MNGMDFNNQSGLPVGSVMWWGFKTLPIGWLACDGASCVAYPMLCALVNELAADFPASFVYKTNCAPNFTDWALCQDGAIGSAAGSNTPQIPVAAHSHSLSAYVGADVVGVGKYLVEFGASGGSSRVTGLTVGDDLAAGVQGVAVSSEGVLGAMVDVRGRRVSGRYIIKAF